MSPAVRRSVAAGDPAADRPLSTGGYVVLGLLLDEPSTGWDLARKIDRSIAHFWPLTKAHVYAELPKLSSKGWATTEDVPQSGAPDRRIYTATAQGRRAFRKWISTVDLTEERGRQPLQLQLFFAAHAEPSKLSELLAAWQERAQLAEQHCVGILAKRGVDARQLPRLALRPSAGRGVSSEQAGTSNALHGLDARGMTALFGLRRAQADLAWLDEVHEALQPGRADKPPSA